MKRVMNGEQKQLFSDRSRTETILGVLKKRFQLVYHMARKNDRVISALFL
jgi:flagellar biosynthesis/type III secretory pathway chaperone